MSNPFDVQFGQQVWKYSEVNPKLVSGRTEDACDLMARQFSEQNQFRSMAPWYSSYEVQMPSMTYPAIQMPKFELKLDSNKGDSIFNLGANQSTGIDFGGISFLNPYDYLYNTSLIPMVTTSPGAGMGVGGANIPLPTPPAPQQLNLDNMISGGFNFGGGFGGGMFGAPGAGFINNNSSNGNLSGNSTEAKEYNSLKALYESMKKAGTLDEATKTKIEEAMKTKGTDAEKLEAMQKAMKGVNKETVKKAILDKKDVKSELQKIGFNMSDSGYININNDKETKKQDDETRKNIIGAYKEVESKKFDKMNATFANSDADPSILRKLSYWHDNYKKTSPIKHIATHLRDKAEEKVPQERAVDNLVKSLLNMADSFTANNKVPEIEVARDNLQKAYDNTSLKGYNQSTISALDEPFQKLYALLRIAEAQRVDKEIAEKNKAAVDAGIITTGFVTEATKKDLQQEGIAVPSVTLQDTPEQTASKYERYETAREQVNALRKDNKLKLVSEGVYESNTADGYKKFYTIKKVGDEDTLVELKNVKAISSGVCTMNDGSKKNLSSLTDADYEITDAAEIVSYIDNVEKAIKSVEELKTNGTLIEVANSDPKIYQLKDGNRFYIIEDGEIKYLKGIEKVVGNKLYDKDGKEVKFENVERESVDVSAITSVKNELEEKIEKLHLTKVKAHENLGLGELYTNGHSYFIVENKRLYKLGTTKEDFLEKIRLYQERLDDLDGEEEANWYNLKYNFFGMGKDEPAELKEDIQEIIRSMKQNKTEVTDETYNKEIEKTEDTKASFNLGKQVCKDLSGSTNKKERDRVDKALLGLNKDNALEFVKGYYEESDWLINNGLFEQLESESDQHNSDYVMNAMKAIIEAFEKAGFDNDDEDFARLKEIYQHYTDEAGDYGYGDGTGKLFNDHHGGWLFGSRHYGLDNPDNFDDSTQNLINKLEEKQEAAAEQGNAEALATVKDEKQKLDTEA